MYYMTLDLFYRRKFSFFQLVIVPLEAVARDRRASGMSLGDKKNAGQNLSPGGIIFNGRRGTEKCEEKCEERDLSLV